MTGRSPAMWLGVAAVAVLALILVPAVVGDDDDADSGFDGYIQSGTCADPSDELIVDLETAEDARAVEPYLAVGLDGEPITLGFYGVAELPGLGLGAVYTDQQFSMVITDADADVACGEILQPVDDRFEGEGRAVAQLLPVGASGVEGVAVLERTSLQRELDITPTVARIILSTGATTVPDDTVPGFEAYIQSGRCSEPEDHLRAELESDDDYDVAPFEAASPSAADPVTVAYVGASGVPGFGLAATYTEQEFSVVIKDQRSAEPVACGDVLEPVADEFTEAGRALVQLVPTGGDEVLGYAVIERTGMERELDVTPTFVRVLMFAPPAPGG
jgi:hypothetical protein